MKADQINRALNLKFNEEGARLVFWHDPNAEFTDFVEAGLSGEIADVEVLDVDQVGGLSAKLHLEREDTSGRYLVYSRDETPLAEEDWLLDIRLYSVEFHADVASIWLHELGLNGLYLRDHLRSRAAFLGNQERRRKLIRLIAADDDEATIDMRMMAVLVGSQIANPHAVLHAICHRHLHGDRFDLSALPNAIALFEKMDLLERFWGVMRVEFGYVDDSPSVAGLLRRLLVSELLEQMEGASIDALAQFALPPAGRRNAVVCLTQWRDSAGTAGSYDAVAAAVEGELGVCEHLDGASLHKLKDVTTFWGAEKRIVWGLKERVLDATQTVDVEEVSALASARRAGHWLAGPGSSKLERKATADAYEAVVAAAELFALRARHRHDLTFDTPGDLLQAYRSELHRFDRLYRLFCTKARPALGQGWDLLKTLAEEVERVYDQGFLQPMGVEWSRLLDEGFLNMWSLERLPAQREFYARTIRPHLAKSDRTRAFVIISDALRYETATELTEALNRQYRMNAELAAMLGGLPSYTALGMASLLPHKRLAYDEIGDVLVDGKPAAGTEGRSKQLSSVGGMACQAADLRNMKREEARTLIDGTRVVYIYHNVIDARGDSSSTEGETFEAVSEAIGELVELVMFCMNTLNASKVWVTADHGFLFQREAPDLTDKSELSSKPAQAVKVKKRYVIGRDLGATPEAHHGSIETTAGAGGGMEFWVPRGTNRFHFKGGARFVHGGAMPQEVLVPLVAVSQLRGEKAAATRSEKVSVHVLGTKHKITTPKYRFEFIQTEAVGERRKPITLNAAVYDGAQPVTSVATITFDSTSDSVDERKKSTSLELRTGVYDKTKPYRLVLRDAESDVEVQSVPVVIDRSFDDDF